MPSKGTLLGIGSIIVGAALTVFGTKKVLDERYGYCDCIGCCVKDEGLAEEDIKAVDEK